MPISLEEADSYGLKATPDARALATGQTRYAMVPQIMPVPDCCSRDRAIGVCTPDHTSRKRVIVPTVVELAGQELTEELLDEHARYASRFLEPTAIRMPVFAGWAVDMFGEAMDWGCGCVMTGDIGCGCAEADPGLFSLFNAVPLSEGEAIQLLATAHRELPGGVYQPLSELVQLEQHGLDTIDDDEDIDYEDPEAVERRIDELTKPLREWLGVKEGGHLHLDRDQVAFTTPEQLMPQYERLMLRTKKTLERFEKLMASDYRTLAAEHRRLFAYPTYD